MYKDKTDGRELDTYQEGVAIPLIGLSLPHFVVSFLMFNELW